MPICITKRDVAEAQLVRIMVFEGLLIPPNHLVGKCKSLPHGPTAATRKDGFRKWVETLSVDQIEEIIIYIKGKFW
jgi:hypothetical protein